MKKPSRKPMSTEVMGGLLAGITGASISSRNSVWVNRAMEKQHKTK
jgi:hypothetical protein